MSINDDTIVQEPLKRRPILRPRGRAQERFLIINHDWFVPAQTLRRLSTNHAENELESFIFPQDELLESEWQLFIEHKSNPSRIQIGLVLLEPHNKCLNADIKLVLTTTHGGQIIKEHFFPKHTFFLTKGEPISSFINDHISPKICFYIEDELYENVMNGVQQGSLLNTNDCTIVAYVRFINEFEIEPKPKGYDLSKRFTATWKLTKFRRILEKINQARPPVSNSRRLLSNPFKFAHFKVIDGFTVKKWKLIINRAQKSSTNKQSPLSLTLKSLNPTQPNYGKFEIACKNEHHILRRYIESMEDLNDSYNVEFFTFDELYSHIYHYKPNFDNNNARIASVDYLLFSIQIVQPLQVFDVLKKIKRITEPTIITLNTLGKTRVQNEENKPPVTENRSPTSQENPMIPRDTTRPIDPVLPPIRFQNKSPMRLRSSSSLQVLPNVKDNSIRSSHSFMNKPIPSNKQSIAIPSLSSTTLSDLTDNFTFLTNLFRSGLHSDITIRDQDHQWDLHKSILSARSIYFNQYFSNSKQSVLDLSDENNTLSPIIHDRMFLFLYTNQYKLEKLPRLSLFETTRLLFEASIKFGIETLTRHCLQDMCSTNNLHINNAANLLIATDQATHGLYEKYHSNDYVMQIKNVKQTILRFIQLNSREVLLSSQWKLLEKHFPFLVHDVLEFVVFEKI
ncbi:unnamed protein product [Rotaria socialis]|uniref:BTB domain-containing protein n=1 Tax=Rotaria socialis TaxID=392032 RepID=A0A820Y689_9BILA|nr:unnamed protein product [Rotaria socialis]CAF4541625.1 unnamed protein product [Rotaria socialis]